MSKILRWILSKISSKSNKVSVKGVSNSTVHVTQLHIENYVGSVPTAQSEVFLPSGPLGSLYSSGLPSPLLGGDKINEAIDDAVKCLKSHKIKEAKQRLFIIQGKIESNKDAYKKELARVYNNLGVCFNVPNFLEGDYEEALKYFTLALEYNPQLKQALANTASVYMNKGGTANIKKAYDIIIDLWKNETNKSFLLPTLLISTCMYKSVKDAIEFYEESKEAQEICKKDEISLNLVSEFYLESGNIDKSSEVTDYALGLFPSSARTKQLKAKTLILKAQRDKIIPSNFSFVPEFSDYQDIEQALTLLEEALELIKDSDEYLATLIKVDITFCSTWLHRANDSKYVSMLKSINTSILTRDERHILEVHNVAACINKRDFSTALATIKNSEKWQSTIYKEKMVIAHTFLLEGAIEEAENILREIEKDAEKEKNIQFFFDLSLTDILLDNKTLAIKEAEKAKEYAKGTSLEKKALSHFNAVMMRYANFGEADRLMSGMFEYNSKYPEDKALTQIEAINKDGQLSDEIKGILLDQKKRYEGIRQVFKDSPAPTYFLEKICKKPYIDIISMGKDNGDPEFTFEFNSPAHEVIDGFTSAFNNAESLVFDYSALLNLAKMDLLGMLSRFDKKIFIVKKLFDKIQEELLSVEKEDLRKLWNFIRKNKNIQIVDNISKGKPELEKLKDHIGDWLIESMKLAKDISATYISDDLRFLNFLKSEKIEGANNYILLREMLNRKFIDDKMYSLGLGDLAERSYIFISFNGDNLFDIVMEDKSKITYRTYHLVNQAFLPYSEIKTFTLVFVRFIYLLWKTGSLPEDKVNWLKFLSNTIKRLVNKKLISIIINNGPIPNFIGDLGTMWKTVISESSKDELILLDNAADEVFDEQYMMKVLPMVKRLIKNRMDELKLT